MSNRTSDQRLKAACMTLLREYGFQTRSIRSSTTRRAPDFTGSKGGQRYVFELKERLDDPEALAQEDRQLAGGEVVASFESMGPNRGVVNKTRDGVEQLLEYRSRRDAFRMLWLHAGGRDAETQLEQVRATLYGIMPILQLGKSSLKRCYYFLESEFFRHRNVLSGAVLTTPDTLQICVNTLSPRLEEFRSSSLLRTFHNALLDPDRAAKRHLIYVADCDHDRRNKQLVLDYLQEKYRRRYLMDMPLTMGSARVRVDR